MTRARMSPVRVNPVVQHPDERRLSLDGEWRFRLDPQDEGLAAGWHEQGDDIGDPIAVPGCWQGQGFGDDGTDTVRDFGLQARTFRATYEGTGWYGRTFEAPDQWSGQRLWLSFGGVHPSAEVWLNSARLGDNDLPFVPFGFDVSDVLSFSDTNHIAVRVHEKHRQLGLAFSWQGNWSGLYRGVDLTATGSSFLEQVRVYPSVEREAMRVRVRVGDVGQSQAHLTLRLAAHPLDDDSAPIAVEIPVTAPDVDVDIAVPSPRLWSPDAPNLYRVDVALLLDGEIADAVSERAGFVELAADGQRILINGKPHYMRGHGDFISCPETGCPDTDRDRWRRKLGALRAYGYNHVRCQSYVYPPEYFDAADEVGLLIQSEMGLLGAWGGLSPWHGYAWPPPTPDNYPALRRQWDLIVERDVNHPSANLYCMSNELADATLFPRIAWRGYRDTKAIKPTALVIWTDGGYNPDLPGDFVNDGLNERTASCTDKPRIEHEFKWWSSFPDVRGMAKYCGAVRPYGAEIARQAAARQGQEHLLEVYADNSESLQLLEMKVKMEALRRDQPDLAGISHFSAVGCNPSPQGVLDEFYERKVADATLWLQTNGDTVVLSSLGIDDRVRVAGEEAVVQLFVSDFSHPPLQAPALKWRLELGGETTATGELRYPHQAYTTVAAGEIRFTLPAVSQPAVATLEVDLLEGERVAVNQWSLWTVPAVANPAEGAVLYAEPKDCGWLKQLSGVRTASAADLTGSVGSPVVLSEILDERLIDFMRTGGRVILAATEGLVRPHRPNFGYVRYFFTPPANYAPYEDGQNGTVIQANPILGGLPHEGYADLQFYRVMENAPPLDLAPLGLSEVDPVIRVIHRYPVCRPLGYLVERRCGQGGLIVCALDLDPGFPEARYLLSAICRYAAAPSFAPTDPLSPQSQERLVEATALMLE